MKLRPFRAELHLIDLHTRMPFRYGIATMTEMPLAFARVWVEINGAEHCGTSSDLLPPKWFTKVPEKPAREEIEEMLTVIRNALALTTTLRSGSVFQIWRQLHEAQAAWAKEQGIPPLLAHFGTSLIERALIEAACRAARRPFHSLLLHNDLGLELGQIHPTLQGLAPSQLLPPSPLQETIARHTIGLSDPLTDADIETKLTDGLPQSLSACIRHYGLKHFKIKVGALDRDLERLQAIADVIRAEAAPDFAFTLDGNEQFKSFDSFREFWAALNARQELAGFLQHMLFVEQPLHRAEALRPEVGEALSDWPDRPPLIIDESDATLDAAATALELGYNGTSHKNCKGVIKGIANCCLITKLNRDHASKPFIMSGEDLCNIGPVALPQDLAVMAALGIVSVERNGHHYNAGLSQFPLDLQRLVLTHHPDLYRASDQGWPTVNITDGTLSLGSVNRAPFGVGFQVPLPFSSSPPAATAH